ncbi:MAG: hypothetical protein R3D70_09445 [Rhizobiaceae bacterium]
MRTISSNGARRTFEKRREGIATGQVRLGKVVTHDVSRRNEDGLPFSKHILRLREIERIIEARHGLMVPETDDGDLYIEAAAFAINAHCNARSGDLDTILTGWCNRWAPWALPRAGVVIRPILIKLRRRKHDLRADDAAKLLQVIYAERQMLSLCTIGACDIDRALRRNMARNRKRKLDRERQAAIRNIEGRQVRESYLAANALSRLKPWVDLNISRRTWYRRFGTSPSRLENKNTGGDTLVPRQIGDTPFSSANPGAALLALAMSAKGLTPSRAEIDADNANGGTEPLDFEDSKRRMGGANG